MFKYIIKAKKKNENGVHYPFDEFICANEDEGWEAFSDKFLDGHKPCKEDFNIKCEELGWNNVDVFDFHKFWRRDEIQDKLDKNDENFNDIYNSVSAWSFFAHFKKIKDNPKLLDYSVEDVFNYIVKDYT